MSSPQNHTPDDPVSLLQNEHPALQDSNQANAVGSLSAEAGSAAVESSRGQDACTSDNSAAAATAASAADAVAAEHARQDEIVEKSLPSFFRKNHLGSNFDEYLDQGYDVPDLHDHRNHMMLKNLLLGHSCSSADQVQNGINETTGLVQYAKTYHQLHNNHSPRAKDPVVSGGFGIGSGSAGTHSHKQNATDKAAAGMKAQFSYDRNLWLPGFGLLLLHKQAVFLDRNAVRLLALDEKLAQQWIDVRKLLNILGREISHQAFKNLRRLRDLFQCCSRSYVFNKKCPYGCSKEDREQGRCPCLDPELAPENSSLRHHSWIHRNVSQMGVIDAVKVMGVETNGHPNATYNKQSTIDPNCDRVTFNIILRHGAFAGTKLYVKFNGMFADGSLSHVNISLSRIASKLFELTPHMVTDSASFDWLIPTDECIYGRNYYTMLGYRNNDPHLPFKQIEWQKTIVHPDDLMTVSNEFNVIRGASLGNNYELLYRSRCRDGSYIWTKYIGTVLARDRHDQATRVLGINIDINRVLEGYEQLQNKVFTDILTGLKNRTYLITHMDDFIAAAKRPMTIIFADITALKVYNDYLGHAIGDKLLFTAALMLKDNIDRVKELIRISGDEIICLLPDCDEKEAHAVSHKIIEAMNHYNINAPIRMPVFFSIGTRTVDLSDFAGRKLNAEEKEEAYSIFYQAIQDADKLMQQNKRLARREHYTLVKAYIEHQLKHSIDITDKRTF